MTDSIFKGDMPEGLYVTGPVVEQTKTFSEVGMVCFSKEEAQATVRAFSAMIGFIMGQGIDVHVRRQITTRSEYNHEGMEDRFYVTFRAALLPSNNMTGRQIVHPLPEVKIGFGEKK